MKELIVHPEGEAEGGAVVRVFGQVVVATLAGRIHVEWDPQVDLEGNWLAEVSKDAQEMLS